MVFNEGVRNAGACLLQLERPLPNTCVRSDGGAVSAGPAAWRLAPSSPRRTDDVQVVGDGGFYFGGRVRCSRWRSNTACRILVLLLDNTAGRSVKESTLRVFPQGTAKATDKFQASLIARRRILQDRRSVRRARREGHQPDDVPAAMKRAVRRRARRPAPRSCTCA